MPRRRCIEPGCSATSERARCPEHARARRAAMYGGSWPALRRRVLEEWRAEHGDWCPGWGIGIDSHPSSDLTVDHVEPGSLAGGVRVLCRSCNSRRGDGEVEA